VDYKKIWRESGIILSFAMVYPRRRFVPSARTRRLRYTVSATAARSARRVYTQRRGGAYSSNTSALRAYRRVYRGRGRKGYLRRLSSVRRRYPQSRSIMEALRVKHPCAYDWIKSLLNPFSGPVAACNPYLPPIYSQRMRTFCRFSLDSGAFNGGSAAIMVRANPANDTSSGAVSDAATAFGDGTTFTVANQFFKNSNSPYPTVSFSATNLSAGITSFGLRFRYNGNAELMGGNFFVFEAPNHFDLQGMTPSQVLNEATCMQLPVSQEWQSLVWSGPQNVSELAYANSATADPFDNYVLLLMIRGVNDPNAQTFECEIWMNHEIVGRSAQGQQFSDQDQVGGGQATKVVMKKTGGRPIVNPPGTGGSSGGSDDQFDHYLGANDSMRGAATAPFAMYDYTDPSGQSYVGPPSVSDYVHSYTGVRI